MIINFFKKQYSSLLQYPWKDTIKSLKFLPRVLNNFEKVAVIVCLAVAVGLGSYLWYQSWLKSTILIAGYGGEFREGIVGESKDLDEHIERLTNAGLTKYDSEKNIVGDLAKTWDINENGKVYIFHLRDGFSSEDLTSQIASKNIWKDIEITTPDSQTIRCAFKQPFSPFLNVSTEPIFNYGPYKIAKEYKDEIELQSRDDYYAGRPFINKVIIKFYNSEEDLLKAAKRGEIQAYSLDSEQDPAENFHKFEMKLPRDLDLFFNLSRKDLQDINVRRALKEGSSPGKKLSLRLVTSDNPKNKDFAQRIVETLGEKGVKINLDVKDNVTLQKVTIPKRDYDLLLYGLDYGEDPDPYPFWHSSQIKEDGKNLSNFKNVKADKLLEEARQELDNNKREEKYAEFQKILDAEIPMFVVQKQNFYYYVSNKIKGIEQIAGSCEADRFLNVASWYINTQRVKK